MGVTLGSAITAAQWAFGEQFEEWVTQPGWTGAWIYRIPRYRALDLLKLLSPVGGHSAWTHSGKSTCGACG
jgi:hypothetical protein